MEQNLRKFHANLRLIFFLCFSYKYVVEYNPTITTQKPRKPPRNPNIIIDKPRKIFDRDVMEAMVYMWWELWYTGGENYGLQVV